MPPPKKTDRVGDISVADLQSALRQELTSSLRQQQQGEQAVPLTTTEGARGSTEPSPGPEPPPAPPPPPFQAAHYTFSLDSFLIGTTRAVHNDTDHVSIGLKVGDRTYQPQVQHMGDVNDGLHQVGLHFADVVVDSPGTPISFNYQIVNSGHQSEADIEKSLVAASLALLAKKFGAGTIWTVLLGIVVSFIADIIFANCDGPCAVDQIDTNSDSLWASTQGVGSFSQTRFYTVESQDGCGDSPRYWVTWSITGTGVIPHIPTVEVPVSTGVAARA